MRLLLGIIICIYVLPLSAQNAAVVKYYQSKDSTYVSPSKETLDSNRSKKDFPKVHGLEEAKDEKIDLLLQDYAENKKILGFRIQLFSSSNRLEAVKVRAEFLQKYPTNKSYLVYQAPNFKVRVGNYIDRLSVSKSLEEIKIDFSSAFVVKDEIEPSLKSLVE